MVDRLKGGRVMPLVIGLKGLYSFIFKV